MQTDLWVNSMRAVALAAALLPVTARAATFNFEDIPAGTALPFTDTKDGLSASFTGLASVCDAGGLFEMLRGHILVQNFCNNPAEGDQSGPVDIKFSADLDAVGFDFATIGAGTLTVEALRDGDPVSTASFGSVIPPGQSNGEGLAFIIGPLDELILSSDSILAIDNVGVPEPASAALLGAGFAGMFLTRRRRKID